MSRIVLDTNCLIQSLPTHSKYNDLWKSCFDGRNILCVSNEILEEYQEILERKTSPAVAKATIMVIVTNLYTEFITPWYHFDLIKADPDDNKFVDCAVVAGAKFIVTNDRHYDLLKTIDFPKIDVISLDNAMKLLL